MTEPVPPQDAERVRTGVVWLVGLAVIAIGAVLVALSWWFVVPAVGARAAVPSPLEHGLFDRATGARDARAAGAHRLERYEWIDRRAGVVHIPIDRAIDAVVADPSLIRAPGAAAPVAAGSTAPAAASVGDAGTRTSLGETGK
ncbi:MAG TPA: hypothetical protein VH165_09180 [Kofleriaceae bacterium]|jgi:hypothetical protein|nr:hypothetical protein [Kofleriaceae bacterium]